MSDAPGVEGGRLALNVPAGYENGAVAEAGNRSPKN